MPNIAKSLHYPTKGQSCVIQKTIDRFARKLAWKPVKSLTQCFLSIPLKTSENLSFSHVSRGYRKGVLALKELTIHQLFVSTLCRKNSLRLQRGLRNNFWGIIKGLSPNFVSNISRIWENCLLFSLKSSKNGFLVISGEMWVN